MDPAERARVQREMVAQATAGLVAAGGLIAERAIANMPVGDPAEDPDPMVEMRERTRVEEQPDGSVIVVVDTEYAAVQHWAQSYAHPRGGEDRFLELALLEVAPEIPAIIAKTPRAYRGGII